MGKFAKKLLNKIAEAIHSRDKGIAGRLGISKEEVQQGAISPEDIACAIAFNIQQEPGAVVELNEKVIKKVIEDWQKPYRWVAFPNYVCRKTKRKMVLVKTNALRVGLLATLPTALVNAKGILKWREKKCQKKD